MAAIAKSVAADSDDTEDEFDIGADAEFIAPKVDLRRKAKERRARPGDIDPIAAAEAAMNDMAQKFSNWMDGETQTLLSAWQACCDADFAENALRELFVRAHDIKGQAATLGFPAAGKVAASLCRLLDLVKPASRIPRDLVRQHVMAVRAIAMESTQNVANALADTLAQRLTAVTDEFIASLN